MGPDSQFTQPAYRNLFRAASETLLEIAADPRRLGARVGVLSVLHTWSQNLSLHPHPHCLFPAGGLAFDHSRWIATKRHGFFLPVRVLSIHRANGLLQIAVSTALRTSNPVNIHISVCGALSIRH